MPTSAAVDTPAHVAIIMDGNGRWATAQGKRRSAGHRHGARAASLIIESAVQSGIQVLTLFTFSSENWNRPPAEVRFLFKLLAHSLKTELGFLQKHHIKLVVIGDRRALSPAMNHSLSEVERLTALNTGMTLVIAFNYGGMWDIVQATQHVALAVKQGILQPEDISSQTMKGYLSTRDLPPVDLCIRTGGEYRVSNFLLWDIAYAELYFSPLLWPEFQPEDFKEALLSFTKRRRRFGLTAH